MKVSKKIILTIVGLGVFGGIIFGTNYLINLQKYKNVIQAISIKNDDLSTISDGTYKGSFDAMMIAADVSVTVINHKITDIKLLRHKTERGQKAEVIPQKVIVAQSLNVDTITGATNSSKVILKAIENALEQKK